MRALKLTDEERVNAYMLALDHPLKDEINAVREIIKNASDKIKERIKWNAPSYYYIHDLVTFNHRNLRQVHLVFHHVAIVQNKSNLLEGDYIDRRMIYFSSMDDIMNKQKELTEIIQNLVQHMDWL